MDKTTEYFSKYNFKLTQPKYGYRAGLDAMLLACTINKKTSKFQKIADLGSGVGCASIALSHRLNNVQITGFEIQKELYNLMKDNIKQNNIKNINALNIDIFKLKEKNKQINDTTYTQNHTYNHIICNPPYYDNNHGKIQQNKIKHIANTMDTNICLYDWVKVSIDLLKIGGSFNMINRAENLDEIISALDKKAGKIKIFTFFSHPLENDQKQTAKRVIVQATKGKKGYCKIFSPIIIHKKNGTYTKEALNIIYNLNQI